jgi:hypothetical protein
MTCIILQGISGSVEDQPRVVEHPSGSGEDPSRHEMEYAEDSSGQEMEFTEDPSRHEMEFDEDPPVVSRRWRTRKSHYVAPPPVPTNPESRPIINQSVGGNHFLYSHSIMVIHANTNCYTHVLQLMGGHHVLWHRPSKAGQYCLR